MNTNLQDSLFWLLCIGALLGNAAIFRARASEYAADDPTVLQEANRILRAFVLYVGGLFLLFAGGSALGLTGRLGFAREARPVTTFDVVYLMVYVAVLGRATWWVFSQGGAAVLAGHHRMFKYFPTSEVRVKLLWALMMLALGFAIFKRLS